MKNIDINSANLLLMSAYGIDISKYDDSFLEKSLQKRMTETGCDTMEKYVCFLEQNSNEITTFSDSLTISYSEFFRNSITYAVLERMVLPAIILKKNTSRRKEIRVWSTACAGGQEAYSLAILLEELKNGNPNTFSYRIFATDQSEIQVQKAVNGQFHATELGNVSLKRAGTWFTRQGDIFTIRPEIMENVDFSVFDLLAEEMRYPASSIFGDFDLVMCANVLFYYKNEFRNALLDKADQSINRGGYLVTGEAERDILSLLNYSEVIYQSAIYQV